MRLWPVSRPSRAPPFRHGCGSTTCRQRRDLKLPRRVPIGLHSLRTPLGLVFPPLRYMQPDQRFESKHAKTKDGGGVSLQAYGYRLLLSLLSMYGFRNASEVK